MGVWEKKRLWAPVAEFDLIQLKPRPIKLVTIEFGLTLCEKSKPATGPPGPPGPIV